MKTKIKPFNRLSKEELYRILQMRAEIFVKEQQAPYLDPDNKDQIAWHLIMKTGENHIMAYTRIFPPNGYFPGSTTIGRVCVDADYRGKAYAYRLMNESLNFLKKHFPRFPVEISAQTYLIKFYQSLGFQQISNEYLEDGLPHVRMKLDFAHDNGN